MIRIYLVLAGLLFIAGGKVTAQIPEGFNIEVVNEDLDTPVGLCYTSDSVFYSYELNGRVWAFVNGEIQAEPILDLSNEVGYWWDHGLMGMALDPDFHLNGYIYLLYVVDRHYLLHYGTEEYHPDTNDYFSPSIGRVTRYTVDQDDLTSVVPGSRKILIGDGREDGIPINTFSHGLGSLIFGRDGTLFFSVGDANCPGSDYAGGSEPPEGAYDNQSVDEGIFTPEEDVGAYRSQYINSYCGKVLRINPENGEGIPGNPFYDEMDPDSPASKVWALGFRNPFRMAFKPFSGSTNPADNDPGILAVGDAGDWSWEEINIIDEPGKNYGWPIYQGQGEYYLFNNQDTENLGEPINNPCNGFDHYRFIDLITQPTADHNESFPHTCGDLEIDPEDAHLFVHERPLASYKNGGVEDTDEAYIPWFNENGVAVPLGINEPEADVEGGEMFKGSASIGGTFYQGAAYPVEYQDAYFHSDYSGWLKVFYIENGSLSKMEHWIDDMGNVVHLSVNPQDENIYVTTIFPGTIKKLSFEGNLKPIIEMTPDTAYGESPLTVEFDATGCYDPEGEELSYEWDFGDGESSTEPSPTHTFSAGNGDPQALDVQLTVSDPEGNSSTAWALVSLNNTPPQAEINSVEDSSLYSVQETTFWNLTADVSDAESDIEELEYNWQFFLHHNTHFHLQGTESTPEAEGRVEPLGCKEETYYYRFRLEVTDPMGLQDVDEVLIYPDCDTIPAPTFSEYTVAPNPGGNARRIYLPEGTEGEVTLELHSASGEHIDQRTFDILEGRQSILWRFRELSTGTYFLRVYDDDGVTVKRIIVAR